MKCLLCEDTGWVCEHHRDRPWEGPTACGCGGAGSNCSCNPDGDYVFEVVYETTRHVQ